MLLAASTYMGGSGAAVQLFTLTSLLPADAFSSMLKCVNEILFNDLSNSDGYACAQGVVILRYPSWVSYVTWAGSASYALSRC